MTGQGQIVQIIRAPVFSWDDVVSIYQLVLGRPVRAHQTPAWVFRLQQLLLRPFSPAASNIMAMNWLTAQFDTAYETTEMAGTFDVSLTTVKEFLRRKARLTAND